MRLALALAAFFATLSLGARVGFWHIPKTAGTSLSAAFFRALGVNETRPFMIENEDDCAEAIDRIMDMPDNSFVHVHHKDFSFATALHRQGVKVGQIDYKSSSSSFIIIIIIIIVFLTDHPNL